MATFEMDPDFEKKLTQAVNAPDSPIRQQTDPAIRAVIRRVRDSHAPDETVDQVHRRLVDEATKDIPGFQPDDSTLGVAQAIVDGTMKD